MFYGQIPEIDVLPVSQSLALIEQAMRSTVFDKKVCFNVSKLKKCRTKSVVLRLPLFGIQFISRGKRDFFQSVASRFN
ncbi:hypothetical protein HMPREF0542_12094 [Ligilactobacillus ruminis ATCC 25644]|uniref:Uncharacterized protein n=1 Tax=Ligilactobacillus ruminis ATCC 25644 TaxID=525362 RepID=E7FT66_9LACO|nr:hypothetical protein HMPREF0542_12094 [Ligilactobacillus ruminis ATCC 25644]EGX98998.1 hypothetical protein ANHS_457 [Ligilactobacillus ruminis ATCC 25644]